MPGEIGQQRPALLDAASGVGFSEHLLRTGLVHTLDESEFRAMLGIAGRRNDSPARQYMRELYDVVLRVAAVDAERVQLEYLAREILVEPAAAVDAGHRSRTDRGTVVEIEQHRRMAFDRQQHVGKAAEYVRPDRFTLV